MKKHATLIKKLQDIFIANANPKFAKPKEKYFKNVIKFYGIENAAELKRIINPFYKEHVKPLNDEDRIEFGMELFDSEYFEDKYAGIETLHKNTKYMNEEHVPKLASLIDSHVYDWGTCDGLSGRVICEMIKRNDNIAPLIQKWKDADCLWRQRAACVSFVKIARKGKHNDIIYDICSTVVKNKERFAQLGNGWVLRELSLADKEGVVQFIKDNYTYFSREGLRYAIEKMDSSLKKELMTYRKK